MEWAAAHRVMAQPVDWTRSEITVRELGEPACSRLEAVGRTGKPLEEADTHSSLVAVDTRKLAGEVGSKLQVVEERGIVLECSR